MCEKAKIETREPSGLLTDLQIALDESSMVAVLDADGVITYVNSLACEILGYEKHELIGFAFMESALRPACDSFVVGVKEFVMSGRVWKGEARIRARNGSPHWLHATVVPVLHENGCVKLCIAVCVDITNRIIAEKELAAREKQLRTLINAMPDIVVFKDGEGRWVETNDFTLGLLGIDPNDYCGKRTSELLADANPKAGYTDYEAEDEAEDEAAWNAGHTIRIQSIIPSADRTKRIFDTFKVPLYCHDGNRENLLILGRDVTEQLHVLEQMRSTKEEYEAIFHNSADAISVLDLDGKILRVNEAFEAIYGWAAQELLGLICPFCDVPEVVQTMQSGGRIIDYETVQARKDGSFIDVSITASPILNAQGDLLAISLISRDITEKRQTAQILSRSEKLSAVGQLASGIAHEIRNPLTALKGFTRLMQIDPNRGLQYTSIMMDELDRINNIVDELLLLAKPQQSKMSNQSVTHLMDHVVTLLEPQAMLRNVLIVREYEEDLPVIRCVENQIKQVFVNIVKNALEATPSGREIRICLSEKEPHWIQVRVIDQGCGIPEELLAKLGEPFYSTKDQGTGLGLTVSYRIVEEHSGRMSIHSEEHEGTMVDIWLPAVHNHEPSLAVR